MCALLTMVGANGSDEWWFDVVATVCAAVLVDILDILCAVAAAPGCQHPKHFEARLH